MEWLPIDDAAKAAPEVLLGSVHDSDFGFYRWVEVMPAANGPWSVQEWWETRGDSERPRFVPTHYMIIVPPR